jgi:hypothetical protein
MVDGRTVDTGSWLWLVSPVAVAISPTVLSGAYGMVCTLDSTALNDPGGAGEDFRTVIVDPG